MTINRNVGSVLFLLFFIIAPLFVQANHAVNINTADKETLMTLTGLGGTGVKAQAVIDYRTQNGPFAKIEDIMNVTGIGQATFDGFKDHITVSGGVQQNEPQESVQTQTQSTQEQSGGGSYPVEPQIIAHAGTDRTVIVGADTVFEGKAFKKDGEPLGPTGIRFLWNFGDGKTAEGHSVFHQWAHPGRYVVTLDVSASKNSASHRIIVTAKAAELALSTLDDGSAVIENKSNDELDVSFWHIQYGGQSFPLPEDTVILVREKIIIPPVSLGFAVAHGWKLLYPNGDMASTAPPPKPLVIHTSITAESAQKTISALQKPEIEKEAQEKEEEFGIEKAAPAAVSASSEPSGLISPWVWAFFGLTAVGAVGAFFASRAGRKEWDIVEDIG